MSHTNARVIQYIAILLILLTAGGAYWYWSVRGATRINTTQNDKLTSGLAGYWPLDGADISGTPTPASGLVGYWKLDEGTGISAADSSGNGNTGTLTNSPTWATGQISNAVSFDGGNDYIRVPDNTNLDGFAQASFTAWVKLNALADGTPYGILDKRTSSGTDDAYSMGLNYGAPAPCTNELEFEVGSAGGSSYVCVDKDVVTWVGQWHHVAFVYDSAATPNYRISIDGVQRTLLRSDDRNATLNNSIRDVTIGIINNAGAGPFNGLIDDVRIYNRALSTAEITQLYNYSGGFTALDRSGNSKNGTITGMSLTPGKIGQALDFNGTADYISVGNVGSVNSVSFWIKADNTTKKIIDLNGTQYVEVSAGTITATGFTSPTIYVDGSVASTIDTDWHHVVITTASTITASAVNLGKVSTGYFDGKLDDVRMYSRVITAGEVTQLYALGTPVVLNASQNSVLTNGLVGQWSFNGADVSDSGISATGGTITADGDYTIHTFTSSGTFTVVSGGGTVEYLVVAGGGGGGGGENNGTGDAAGGGGAGGYRTATGFAVTVQEYTVTVGSGGAGAAAFTAPGTKGNDSIFSSITATGGGYGAAEQNPGGAGGSGGGGGNACSGGDQAGGAGNTPSTTPAQGYAGGTAVDASCTRRGGAGGGGSSGVGADNLGNGGGGAGGSGTVSSITGTAVARAGGGGGGTGRNAGSLGGAGQAGGGNGGNSPDGPGGSATANTGSGGGAAAAGSSVGGAGGSGIVIIRYLTATGTANDTSGSGNNGTLTGTTRTIGRIGQALRFDGVDDYVSAGINLSGASVVTVSFWAKWTTNANDDKLVLEYTNNFNGKNGFIADWNTSTGDFSFGTSKSDSTYWVDGFTRPSAGEWHHVVLVMDRATPVNTAYVDGVSQSLTTLSHNSASMGNFDNSTLYFMSRGGASLFGGGILDDVRIYSRVLSASEIQTLYRYGS